MSIDEVRVITMSSASISNSCEEVLYFFIKNMSQKRKKCEIMVNYICLPGVNPNSDNAGVLGSRETERAIHPRDTLQDGLKS